LEELLQPHGVSPVESPFDDDRQKALIAWRVTDSDQVDVLERVISECIAGGLDYPGPFEKLLPREAFISIYLLGVVELQELLFVALGSQTPLIEITLHDWRIAVVAQKFAPVERHNDVCLGRQKIAGSRPSPGGASKADQDRSEQLDSHVRHSVISQHGRGSTAVKGKSCWKSYLMTIQAGYRSLAKFNFNGRLCLTGAAEHTIVFGTKICREKGIEYARRLLGHTNITTTQRYMHLDERELADAQDLIE
jgi:hypothetical protein